ncbi:transposable element Tcb2 transposase [Trichonephila clavipes]|nr:transposable element Tcb2 transposase [Trichonephila clavipes]
MDQWATVLFTYESRLSLNTDSRRTFILREPGTRYLPSNVCEIDNYGGGSGTVFLVTKGAGRRRGQGRRRATTPNEDRFLVLTGRRHRNMNATIQQHLRSATGTMVSTQTVRNRLHGVGLYARRRLVDKLLATNHPHKLSKNWKELFWKSGTEYPNS